MTPLFGLLPAARGPWGTLETVAGVVLAAGAAAMVLLLVWVVWAGFRTWLEYRREERAYRTAVRNAGGEPWSRRKHRQWRRRGGGA